MLTLAYILNIIDYIFTAHWVNKFGISVEFNPIGRWMLENNVAWVFKIFIVGALFALLGYLLPQMEFTKHPCENMKNLLVVVINERRLNDESRNYL